MSGRRRNPASDWAARLAAAVLLAFAFWGLSVPASSAPALAETGAAPRLGLAGAPAIGEAAPSRGLGAIWLDFQRATQLRITTTLRGLRDGGSIAGLAAALGMAFGYGVLHALGPGHGKAVIVGYFLGREARIGRGLLMGLQIAVMHIVSAVVVVLPADFLLRRAFGGAPAEIPAVRAASYGLILLIGLWLLTRAIARLRASNSAAPAHGHGHAHEHGEHAHEPHGCGHAHGRDAGLLALAVGLVPCSGAVLVLLYALANGIMLAGLAIVAAIAGGMAITMGALGLLSVYARRLVLVGSMAPRRGALLELAGALLVTGCGAVLLATAV